MFKKLLANLPFSLGLLRQVSAYRHKLRRETRLRALGLGLLALAFVVQLFTLSYAPQRLVAEIPAGCIYNSAKSGCLPAGNLDKNKQLTLLVLGFMTAISAYLYIRSRLMSREIEVVRQQYLNNGGA